MKDIAPDLLKAIQDDFKERVKTNAKVRNALKAMKSKNATFKDANSFAETIGDILAESFKKNIRSELLPDERMYYNIAERVVGESLKNNYNLVSEYSADVQTLLNRKANLGLKGIKPQYNADKAKGIINRISSEEKYEDISWILEEPVTNFTQSIVDDTIKRNAEFQYKAGLKAKIIRKSTGHCCDWCEELAGEYEYPDVPKDVYRRHRFCRCTVEYEPGNGRRQNVHSKKWRDIGQEERIERIIELSESEKVLAENKKALRTDIGFDLVDDSIDKIDSVLLDKNIKQLGKLEDKFGSIHKSFGSISSENSGNAIAYVSRPIIDPSKQNLVLNRSYFSQETKLIKEAEEAIKHNWSMPMKVENYSVYTVTHEYGHILQNSIMAEELNEMGGFQSFKTKATTIQGKVKSYKRIQENIQKRHCEEIIEIAEKNSNEPNEIIKNNLSRYGQTNYAEFFAEVFANSQLGEPNELGNAMNEWLKKKGF